MVNISPVRVLRTKFVSTLIVVLTCWLIVSAQPGAKSKGASEQRTSAYFESIRKSPPK